MEEVYGSEEKNWLRELSLIAGLILLCVILVNTIVSVKTTGQLYVSLKEADLSQGLETSLYYDDHLYASIGYGISILPDETGKEARLTSFISASLQPINMRIIACGLLYGMMVSVVLQYYLYCRFHSNTKNIS